MLIIVISAVGMTLVTLNCLSGSSKISSSSTNNEYDCQSLSMINSVPAALPDFDPLARKAFADFILGDADENAGHVIVLPSL